MNRIVPFLAIGAALSCHTVASSRTAAAINRLTTSEAYAVAKCQATWSESHSPVAMLADQKNNISAFCFDGTIDRSSAEAFITSIGEAAHKPIVVIRSGGGEVNAGMDIGDAIKAAGATVIVAEKCLSSCANYILISANRRVVLKDALLGFHGGVEVVDRQRLVKEFAAAGFTQPKQVNAAIKRSEDDRARQDRFLRVRGVSAALYDKIISWNDMPKRAQVRYCADPDSVRMFVFDPALLFKYGYDLQAYLGPSSKKGLEQALSRQKRKSSSFCYIDAGKSFFPTVN